MLRTSSRERDEAVRAGLADAQAGAAPIIAAMRRRETNA